MPEPGAGAGAREDAVGVVALDRALLDAWNRRRADEFAALFTEGGHSVGFDGATIAGRAAIAAHLGAIFADHPTAAYVGTVRAVDRLAQDGAMARAAAGMIPPGGRDLNPDANAIQLLVAVRRDGRWRIALFQNTPAAFHGRPEARGADRRTARAPDIDAGLTGVGPRAPTLPAGVAGRTRRHGTGGTRPTTSDTPRRAARRQSRAPGGGTPRDSGAWAVPPGRPASQGARAEPLGLKRGGARPEHPAGPRGGSGPDSARRPRAPR